MPIARVVIVDQLMCKHFLLLLSFLRVYVRNIATSFLHQLLFPSSSPIYTTIAYQAADHIEMHCDTDLPVFMQNHSPSSIVIHSMYCKLIRSRLVVIIVQLIKVS